MNCRIRAGMNLVEVLVATGILGAVVALLLPAVAGVRESARRTQCASRLRQIGIGLHAYEEVFAFFPAGYVANDEGERDGGSWGWGALLLPFVEQSELFDQLGTRRRTLGTVAAADGGAPLLRTDVSLYRCPSDSGTYLSHRFRYIAAPIAASPNEMPPGVVRGPTKDRRRRPVAMHRSIGVLAHIAPGAQNSDEAIPQGAMRVGKANFVGSHGSLWKSQRKDWSDEDFRGTGVFGRNSAVRMSKIVDGTSKTLAVGERCSRNYAAAWPGGNSWRGCGFADNQMILGTAAYPINQASRSENIDCDGRGSANFSSFHNDGANFLWADGAVSFLTQEIDGALFRTLARRDDGENVVSL